MYQAQIRLSRNSESGTDSKNVEERFRNELHIRDVEELDEPSLEVHALVDEAPDVRNEELDGVLVLDVLVLEVRELLQAVGGPLDRGLLDRLEHDAHGGGGLHARREVVDHLRRKSVDGLARCRSQSFKSNNRMFHSTIA